MTREQAEAIVDTAKDAMAALDAFASAVDAVYPGTREGMMSLLHTHMEKNAALVAASSFLDGWKAKGDADVL